MFRSWMSIAVAATLGLSGCAETEVEQPDEARVEAEQQQEEAAIREVDVGAEDQLIAERPVDEVIDDGNTPVAPQHVLRPSTDGELIEPVDGEAADEARLDQPALDPDAPVATPESTPSRGTIEEGLSGQDAPLSRRLEERLAAELEPPAESEETLETIRAEDHPVRDEPVTETPALNQEELGEEIAPARDGAVAAAEEAREAGQAIRALRDESDDNLIDDTVEEVDDQVGETAATIEREITEALEAADEATRPADQEELPPTIPLEQADVVEDTADEAESDKVEPQTIEANKPVFDLEAAVEPPPELFSAETFQALGGTEGNAQATDEVKQAEQELAQMREALNRQRVLLGEIDVHLSSLQQTMRQLEQATDENRKERVDAVTAAAKALENSLTHARAVFPASEALSENSEADKPVIGIPEVDGTLEGADSINGAEDEEEPINTEDSEPSAP